MLEGADWTARRCSRLRLALSDADLGTRGFRSCYERETPNDPYGCSIRDDSADSLLKRELVPNVAAGPALLGPTLLDRRSDGDVLRTLARR